MAKKSWTKFRGVMQPVPGDEPLIIEFCKAFIANLRLLLNVAMVFGAVYLANEIRGPDDDASLQPTDYETTQEASQIGVAEESDEGHVLTDGVLHALNCTYEEYLREHYAECVEEGSEIYRPIEADPDDAGFIFEDPPVMMASIIPAS